MEDVEKNKKIISRLKQLIEKDEEVLIRSGDLSDLGNWIGIAIGPYIEKDSMGYELNDLDAGIQHGIDLAKNHSEYIKLEDDDETK